jgi:hypothetical protein
MLLNAELKTRPRGAAAAPFIPGGGVGADSRTHQLVAKTSRRAIKAPSFPKSRGMFPEVRGAVDGKGGGAVLIELDWTVADASDRLPPDAQEAAERDREGDDGDQAADGGLPHELREVRECQRPLSDVAPRIAAFLPPLSRRAPNQKKEKLQQVFSYTTGSILPRELLPGSGA